LNW
jgi:hypothetical protein